MSFPAHPSPGDIYTTENTVFTFNGSTWDRTVVGASNRTAYAHNIVTTALLSRISHLEALITQGLLIID